MTELDVQQALSLRYRTSQEADRISDRLRQNLGLDTRASVARLAIGRSLALGPLKDSTIDSKGLDIAAMSLFSPENIGAWVGLLVSHSISTGSPTITSMDALRSAVRGHWHRGAHALWEDWNNCDEDYDRFIETLVTRRSDMPEFAARSSETIGVKNETIIKATETKDLSTALTKALDELSIRVQVKGVVHGPRISRYRALLVNLSDLAKMTRSTSQLSLALNLGNAVPTVSNGDEPKTVFIDLPRPKNTWKQVGIERMREWAKNTSVNANQLTVYAGVDVVGQDLFFDLASAPHLLVGGTTGSGKSVCLHSLILSLLLRHNKETLQLALIDPKRVEFASYSKLSNLYGGAIATEIPQARELLENLVVEMEERYSIFNRIGVNGILEARKKGQTIPFIVLFIEEMADLVMQDAGIEPVIARLAQKARAAGIHLVLATQRPDAETFSGLIRSNIPGRIALTVQKGTESNIILDEKGAENLLGAGDMLLRLPGETVVRAHSVYIRTENVDQIVSRLS